MGGLAACGGDDGGGGGGSDGPYQVGYVATLSGPVAPVGTALLGGINLAVDAANKDGGVNGRQIKLITADDAGDPSTGVTAARGIVANKDLVLVTGGDLSAVIDAVLPTFTREKLSFLTQGASPTVVDPVQETAFIIDQTSSSNAQPMATFAADLLGKDDFKVAIGPVDTPSGEAWGDNMETLEKDNGFSITDRVPVPVTAGDMTAQAQNLIAGSPDILLVEAPDGPLVPLVQKVRELGYTGPIVNFSYGSATKTVETIADQDLYVFRTSAQYNTTSTDPGTKKFVELVDAAGDQDAAKGATQYSQGYMLGLTIVAALDKCGADCTREDMTGVLNDIEVPTDGFTPYPLKFTSDNHQATSSGSFYSWDGSAIVPALDGKAYAGSVYSLDEELPSS
jgi:branched-chain amino acid transport system substrate-binding protein